MATNWFTPILISLLLVGSAHGATLLDDEGSLQGPINRIDCVGDFISCTRSGITGTFTVQTGDSITVNECVYWATTSTSMCFNSTLNTMTLTVNNVVVQTWSTESGGFLLLDDGTSFILLDDGASKIQLGFV